MANGKKNVGKAPSIQFYWKDWLSDRKLQGLPHSVKGLWIDLICLSCDMPTPGVFFDEGGALKKREIVEKLTGNRRKTNENFKILLQKKILKKFTNGEFKGAFYVQRIYKDMKLRAIRQACGGLGGNPNLLNQRANQTLTPSSSTSSSIYTIEQVKDLAYKIGIPDEKAEAFYHHYNSQGWLKGNGLPITDLQSALVRWRNNQYKFEPKDKPPKPKSEEQFDKERKRRICNEYGDYLKDKTTEALKDLLKDKAYLLRTGCGFLIRKILAERA